MRSDDWMDMWKHCLMPLTMTQFSNNLEGIDKHRDWFWTVCVSRGVILKTLAESPWSFNCGIWSGEKVKVHYQYEL